MTHTRPERPSLATGICALEVSLLALMFIAMALTAYLHHVHPETLMLERRINPHLYVRSVRDWCAIGVDIVGVIALWRMNRAAVPIFIARAGVSIAAAIVGLIGYVSVLARMRVPASATFTRPYVRLEIIRLLTPCLIIGMAAMQLVIAWAVYDIFRNRDGAAEPGRAALNEGYA